MMDNNALMVHRERVFSTYCMKRCIVLTSIRSEIPIDGTQKHNHISFRWVKNDKLFVKKILNLNNSH